MRTVNLLYSILLAGFVGIISCKQTNEPGAVPEEPYPTVEEQREALDGRDVVHANRVLDSATMIQDLAFLTSPECEGRKPGTAGHEKALQHLLQRLRAVGVDSLSTSLVIPFTGRSLNGYTEGRNLVGLIKGTKYPDKYIVLSAHYDHLGLSTTAGQYYAGADDNASGAAAILAIASRLKQTAPEYSVIVALLDREETGLEGAYNLVNYLETKFGKASLVFNLNLDMVARSDKNELFVCGVRYQPAYATVIKSVQPKTAVNLLMGHDGAGPGDDWTHQSDQSAFYQKGIPFLYLGVEDHPDYHKVTDRFEKVNLSAYVENAHAILLILQEIQSKLS